MKYAIQAPLVFDGEALLKDHSVVIENSSICSLSPSSDLPQDLEIRTLDRGILAPGFIDIQVNGGGGVMLNVDPCKENVDIMVAAHRPTGTTAMMPTMISDTPEKHKSCVEAVRAAQASGNKGVLGVHIEGPFFDLGKRGAHKASMIRTPLPSDIAWLESLSDMAAIVTLAPEHTLAGQIRSLSDAGIHVCAGHTNASYDEIRTAIDEGLKGFTHLFNAMRPLTARDPGTVGAAIDSDETWAGIIADGHHVDPATIRIAYRAKPRGKLLLVTDAMATVGSEQSFFEIYDERIQEHDGRLINADGVLAGSAIGMIDAVRIATTKVGIPLQESLRMAALYPAEFLGLGESMGRIRGGYRADIVHFDEDYKVHGTWVAGQYQPHGLKPTNHRETS